MSAGPRASPGTADTWAKRLGLRVASAALGASIALVLAEHGLRWAGPAWLRHRIEVLAVEAKLSEGERPAIERRDGKFLRFVPGSRLTMRHPEFNAVAHFDALGGRDTGGKGADAAGGVLPFLGDSFTFGFGVADGESFVSLLGPRLGRRVLNLGVPGTSLPNQLDIVELRHDGGGPPSTSSLSSPGTTSLT